MAGFCGRRELVVLICMESRERSSRYMVRCYSSTPVDGVMYLPAAVFERVPVLQPAR